jgi:hypothetical protein
MMTMNTEEVQKLLKWGRVAVIVLAVFLAVETLGALKNLRDVSSAYNSISVTGEGEAVSIPDVATFSFTVSSDAKLVSDAQRNVTEKVNAIIAELETLGIDKKDIKTTDYSVWPKYVYGTTACSPTFCPPSRQTQDGYTANHSISVIVRKTEDAGEALALAGEKGATGLSNISFTVDDPNKVLDEARAQAIEDAKSKAKLLSKELGVKLVRVVNFYDNTGRGPIPYYAEGMGGDMIKSSELAVAPTIPVGENKVIVSVTVVYEIR